MRGLATFLLTVGLASAQSPALIQQVFNAAATASASGPVNNVGQVGHAAYLSFTNAPAQTCSNPAATAQLEYSFDNSTYTAFGNPTTGITISNTTSAYFGQGAFAYIRFNITAFDTTHCRATVWYVGTATSAATAVTAIQNTPNACTATAAVPVGGAFAAIPTSITSVTSATTCLQQLWFNNTTGSACTFYVTDGQGSPVSIIGSSGTPFSINSGSFVVIQAGGAKVTSGFKWAQTTSNCITAAWTGLQ